MKTKLNIGCGRKPEKGYINIDKSYEVGADAVVDVEEGLPYPDNYFDEIYSSHTLQAIRPDKWYFVLNEIYRVAKPNCVLHLILPFDNIKTRTNCDNYRTFSWWSFLPLEENSGYNYYSPLKLRRIKKFPNKFVRIFFAIFSFFKNEIELKYKIIKDDE